MSDASTVATEDPQVTRPAPAADPPPRPAKVGDLPPAIAGLLDLARWAPSGDNTQPWRFEVLSDRHVVVHGHDTRHHCVYDLDGWASRLSIGALLETLALAASAHHLQAQVARQVDAPEQQPRFDVFLRASETRTPDPLVDAIRERSVQRRPYSSRALTARHKAELGAAVGPGFDVLWLEGVAARSRAAALMFRSARLRLTTPEAYAVHREVIDWGRRYSPDKVPDAALGVPGAMLAMMKFAMGSWGRVRFFNRFLAGTWMPRLQMDLWPALACGAHFAIVGQQPTTGMDGDFEAGRAMQRFWLTATRLGLCLQPEMTPLIFARYAAQGRVFSQVRGTSLAAKRLAGRLQDLFGTDLSRRGVFLGRIGHGPAVVARSIRLDLPDLIYRGPATAAGLPATGATHA